MKDNVISKKKLVSDANMAIFNDRYRFTSDKGVISMVEPCMATFNTYEIYSIKGDLFEDIERFDSLEEAEARIKELLS